MTGRAAVRAICTVFCPGSRSGAVSWPNTPPAHDSAQNHAERESRIDL
jgi:hypothetical protein